MQLLYSPRATNPTTNISHGPTDVDKVPLLNENGELDSSFFSSELTSRGDANITLQNNLNFEITTRADADTTLHNNVNSEITARADADLAEKTLRQDADTTLRNSINSEITARRDADTTLRNSINSEITARRDADLSEVTARADAYIKAQGYDLSGFCVGKPIANGYIFYFPVVRPFSLPLNLAGSICKSRVPATASTTYTIKNNGSSIGTMVFAISGVTATLTLTATNFIVGDIITVEAPAVPDGAQVDIGFTLLGTVV